MLAMSSKLTVQRSAGGKKMRPTLLCLLVLLMVMSCLTAPLLAQDTFTAGTGNWSVGTNWSLQRPPTRTDDCILPMNSVVTSDLAGECANFTQATGASLTITPGYLFVYSTSFVNQGTIGVGNGNGLAFVTPSITTTMTGGGTINLTTAGTVFSGTQNSVVNVDNTIRGQGFMDVTQFTNQALIDANIAATSLQLHAAAAPGITNTGTIQASNGGTLQLAPQSNGIPFNNTGGTIQALTGSVVQLNGGYLITGGNLITKGSGVFEELNVTTLNNLTSNANFQLINGNITILEGTITNNGTFTAQHGGLQIMGTVTLKGTGTVTGGDSGFIHSGCCGAANLINQQTIQGGGAVGDASFTLTNQATLNANNPAASMVFNGTPEFNTGTIEASNGATLEIQNTVNNTGGTISAQTGSTVLLSSGTINGGTLSTSGTGMFASTSGMLDGSVNVPTNAGLFTVPAGDNLLTKGTINNTGTIALGPNGGCIGLEASTTITGSGQVTMTPNSCFLAFAVGLTLTNQSMISGAGSIGDSNPMGILNTGTIIANQSTPLAIVPDSTGFSNQGTLIVNSGSVMDIRNLFKNISKNKLTGGIYNVAGTLDIFNANIVTNNASITLSGPSAQIFDTSTNSSALRNLASNSGKGVLALTLGQNLATAGNFSNGGKVSVDATSSFTAGGSFTQTGGTTTVDGTLTAPSGFNLKKGKFFGQGTIAAAFSSSGTGILTVGDSAKSPGVLSVTSFSQGATGVIDILIGGTNVGSQYSRLASSNGVSLGGILTIKRIRGFVPAIGNTFTIVKGSVITGQFATVNGLSINSGEHFQINYSSTAVTLTVVSGP